MLERVLVTGANGFIGSHVANRLSKTDCEVIALVRDVTPSKWIKEALNEAYIVNGDINDFQLLKRVLNQYEIDTILHFAALAKVRTAYKDPINVFETNTLGTVKLLEAARQSNVERIYYQNTDKHFGECIDALPTDPPKPSEPYATSKACGSLAVQCFQKTYGLNTVIVQSCNIYGYDEGNRLIPNTIRACLAHKNPIIFKGYSPKRQYIYIEDVVDAILYLTEKGGNGPYNIATKDILTQEDMVKKILECFGEPHLLPKYVDREETFKEVCDESLVLSAEGWEPKTTLEDGLRQTIAEFQKYDRMGGNYDKVV